MSSQYLRNGSDYKKIKMAAAVVFDFAAAPCSMPGICSTPNSHYRFWWLSVQWSRRWRDFWNSRWWMSPSLRIHFQFNRKFEIWFHLLRFLTNNVRMMDAARLDVLSVVTCLYPKSGRQFGVLETSNQSAKWIKRSTSCKAYVYVFF